MNINLLTVSAKWTILFGALTNILLCALKVFVGMVGHSHALVADGVHSLADLLTDFLVLLAERYGGQAADSDHPYGHGRIQTASTVVLAVLLIITGFGLAYDAFMYWQHSQMQSPSIWVFAVALFAILSKEGIYRYTMWVANILRSDLMRANAWHHRSDAASSLVVLCGVSGTYLGYFYLDAMAAIVVAIMIGKMGIDLAWQSLRELVDTGVDQDRLKLIHDIIESVPGVLAFHQLRTRWMNGEIFVDVHIRVGGDISVSEGHHISHLVHTTLMAGLSDICDVTVHIDVEEEGKAALTTRLPLRTSILNDFKTYLGSWPYYSKIQAYFLHYLEGKVHIDIQFPLSVLEKVEAQVLLEQMKNATKSLPYLGKLRCIFIDDSFKPNK